MKHLFELLKIVYRRFRYRDEDLVHNIYNSINIESISDIVSDGPHIVVPKSDRSLSYSFVVLHPNGWNKLRINLYYLSYDSSKHYTVEKDAYLFINGVSKDCSRYIISEILLKVEKIFLNYKSMKRDSLIDKVLV